MGVLRELGEEDVDSGEVGTHVLPDVREEFGALPEFDDFLSTLVVDDGLSQPMLLATLHFEPTLIDDPTTPTIEPEACAQDPYMQLAFSASPDELETQLASLEDAAIEHVFDNRGDQEQSPTGDATSVPENAPGLWQGAETLQREAQHDPELLALMFGAPPAGIVCQTCGRGCTCAPLQPPAEWPPPTTWANDVIIDCLPRSDLGEEKALRWCRARINELLGSSGAIRFKIGMTGNLTDRWNSKYQGVYDTLHALHAMRSKRVAFMLEAALIAIFEQQDIGWCVLVNSEVGDRGGTGCPRDDEPWYYVYIVSIDGIGKQKKQYQLRAGASSKLTDSTNLQTARPN